MDNNKRKMVSIEITYVIGTDIEQDIELDVAEDFEGLWNIFIHNDDVTPYNFVIHILQNIFQHNALEAEYITFLAHTKGIAHVATLPQPEAKKRVDMAHVAARLAGYPLTFTIEPE